MLGISLNPIDWVTSAGGAILGGVTDGIFDALTGWVEDALAYMGEQLALIIAGLSDGSLSSDAFSSLSGMMRYLATAVVIGTIMTAAAGALLSKRVDLDDVVRDIPTTLVMIVAWSSVAALWLTACRELTVWALSDTLTQTFEAGLSIDPGIASFFRFLIAIVMLLALAVFAIEMLFLGFLAPFAVAVGPISLALRPWPNLRDVARRMVTNFVLLTLTPFLTCAAMSFALRSWNGATALGFVDCLRAIAGLAVAVLMPGLLKRYLPLDGQGGSAGRAMLAAAAGLAAAGAAMAATGGAAAAAAPVAGGGQLNQLAGSSPAAGGGGEAAAPAGGGGPTGGGAPPAVATRSGSNGNETVPSRSETTIDPPASPVAAGAVSADGGRVHVPAGTDDAAPVPGPGSAQQRDRQMAALAGAQVAQMLGGDRE